MNPQKCTCENGIVGVEYCPQAQLSLTITEGKGGGGVHTISSKVLSKPIIAGSQMDMVYWH